MDQVKPSKAKSLVIANNDIVYLWWTYPKRIKNCLGFSIHRVVNGKEEDKGLPAFVGFDAVNDTRKSPQTTDEWPIQSFNWKDVYAPQDKKVAYKIIPMLAPQGDWKNLVPDTGNTILTEAVKRTQVYGDMRVIFNRGLLSTQAFAKGKKMEEDEGKILKGAKGLISEKGNVWRKRLGGQMLENIHAFFKQKGKFYCALYELSDTELLEILEKSKGAEIILSSSESNTVSRKRLHAAMKAGKLNVYDRMMPDTQHIGHNKFVVYTDSKGKPKAVLTGSTNWTPTGLCGQTNNMVIVNNSKVAEQYLAYWHELKNDTTPKGDALQDAVLRNWCRENHPDLKAKNKTSVSLRFSPNTEATAKPKNITPAAVPVDMDEVFQLINGAKKQVLYLVFNPGTPSIIDEVVKAAKAAKDKGTPIFVRGAISDAQTADRVTTNIISKDATLSPDKYQVTGVAAIPGKFSYWEQELLKLGFATIHDKILVIDPFDEKKCAVVTGSHNLGFKASFTNDENMLLIRGNTDIAKAYTAHILDVVNHFRWRYKLHAKVKGKKGAALTAALSSAWHDLDETDGWMAYYYDASGDLKKEQLLFR